MKAPIVGYQGEPGAFSEGAARALIGDADTRGFATFEALVEAVDARTVEFGLLPVENSIYGAIARAYDLLWMHPALTIVDETVFRVVQALIGTLDADIDNVVEVRSHPVALEQCRKLFDEFPAWERTQVPDTAGAVAEIVELGDPRIAAIASAGTAERYGGKVLRDRVQDDAENFTRFFLVQAEGAPLRKLGRACVALELQDRPGSLRDALSALADAELNLRSLVSRPSRTGPFKYRFYCEIERVDIGKLARALDTISGEAKILGIY